MHEKEVFNNIISKNLNYKNKELAIYKVIFELSKQFYFFKPTTKIKSIVKKYNKAKKEKIDLDFKRDSHHKTFVSLVHEALLFNSQDPYQYLDNYYFIVHRDNSFSQYLDSLILMGKLDSSFEVFVDGSCAKLLENNDFAILNYHFVQKIRKHFSLVDINKTIAHSFDMEYINKYMNDILFSKFKNNYFNTMIYFYVDHDFSEYLKHNQNEIQQGLHDPYYDEKDKKVIKKYRQKILDFLTQNGLDVIRCFHSSYRSTLSKRTNANNPIRGKYKIYYKSCESIRFDFKQYLEFVLA